MNYKEAIERTDVVDYLLNNNVVFPKPTGNYIADERLYKTWRFVESLEGEMLFANCILPGISTKDVERYKSYIYKKRENKNA